MQPLVQSALDAANRGENSKALELCKQALAADPNDVDAWLVVAAVVEQPERKRQCLNRVLSLDPTNQIAREELLEMDRAAMGGTPVQPTYEPPSSYSDYPASTSAFEPEPVSEPMYQAETSDYTPSTLTFEAASAPEQSPLIAPQVQAEPVPRSASRTRVEKPLVFRYPLFWRILLFVGVVFFACLGLLAATENILYTLAFFGFALATGLVAISYLFKVEVMEAGIRTSNVLGSSAVKWADIKSLKSGGMSQNLELVKSNGQVIKVSNQVSGYPRIVEILRQKRPDLFSMAAPVGQGNPASGYEQASSAPAFSGTKKFEKSSLRQYRSYILVIPLGLISAWTIFAEPQYRIGAAIMLVFCLIAMVSPLFEVSGVKVEPNRLTIETPFEQKVLAARQVREIKMQTVRNRYGTATNFVVIVSMEGKKYSLSGFAESSEIQYGLLTNWWNAYRNR